MNASPGVSWCCEQALTCYRYQCLRTTPPAPPTTGHRAHILLPDPSTAIPTTACPQTFPFPFPYHGSIPCGARGHLESSSGFHPGQDMSSRYIFREATRKFACRILLILLCQGFQSNVPVIPSFPYSGQGSALLLPCMCEALVQWPTPPPKNAVCFNCLQ